jgi:phosphonoacetaldehyde hydrolase
MIGLVMIKAVIFDWAGTTVDYGSRAPMAAFVELFRRHQVRISVEEARVPMGLNKWNHIDALLNMPQIQEQWFNLTGRHHINDDVDRLIDEFIPLNKKSIVDCALLIPGVVQLTQALQQDCVRIGSTTGYTRELMEILIPLASNQGYSPEITVCAGETPHGRPMPDMMVKCAEFFKITEPSSMIKVDDTSPGIEEGKNFGCWTVGVALSGNALGLSKEEFEACTTPEQERLTQQARDEMSAMKPDYVIDTVADLMPIIDAINERISKGEFPKK